MPLVPGLYLFSEYIDFVWGRKIDVLLKILIFPGCLVTRSDAVILANGI